MRSATMNRRAVTARDFWLGIMVLSLLLLVMGFGSQIAAQFPAGEMSEAEKAHYAEILASSEARLTDVPRVMTAEEATAEDARAAGYL